MAMRLYLDQMLHADLAGMLREHGHDVVRASEIGQARADDAEILERASQTARIVITLDKDFGDWVVLPLDRHLGVIRVKIHPPFARNIAEVLLPFLASHRQEQLQNHLVILSPTSARWIKTAAE
jgi:predicted nuclease of predicted toxin-antitoxin system